MVSLQDLDFTLDNKLRPNAEPKLLYISKKKKKKVPNVS